MQNLFASVPESKGFPRADQVPAGFSPATHPILARHWFGIKSRAAVAADTFADVRIRRQVQRLHAKGDRWIAELLAEIAAERGLGTIIDEQLDRYLALPDEDLDATGGRS